MSIIDERSNGVADHQQLENALPSLVTGIAAGGATAAVMENLVDASILVQPRMQISLTSSNYVRLSWPTNSAGFTLQQNLDLNTTNWIAVTNAVNVVSTDYQANIATQGAKQFFRLVNP